MDLFVRHWGKMAVGLALIAGAWVVPGIEFDQPLATALYARDGRLLSARIAADGQWRFPVQAGLPDKYREAVLAFEDRRFYWHPGIDPVAVGRAVRDNVAGGHIVSGASTITMQLARISRSKPARGWWDKALEAAMAVKHELFHDKDETLALYAGHAPFGGNTVGLEAATWRFFGKGTQALSWAEAAALAVLPNAPGLIFTGKNRQRLLERRNTLLRRLHGKGLMDAATLSLALEEPLPGPPQALPDNAPHLAEALRQKNGAGEYDTSLDVELQATVNQRLAYAHSTLRHQGIHNAAALIIDLNSHEVVAYGGNIPGLGAAHAPYVDLIQAPRSTGSILKPLLVTQALQSGQYGPTTWLRDVPCWIRGYHPENYHKGYDGLVAVNRALVRSLNIPMVLLLQDLGIEAFLVTLRNAGLRDVRYTADHYGLSLITGGAESTLWDVTQAYAGLALLSRENPPTRQAPTLRNAPCPLTYPLRFDGLDAGAAYATLQIMRDLERPGGYSGWRRYEGAPALSWKTGTSFGYRDAWAVGVNGNYAVGVWVGNASGEGRPGIIGVEAAAPLMLDLFRALPHGTDPEPPYDRLDYLAVCAQSGLLPGDCCPRDTLLAPLACRRIAPCPYHRRYYAHPATGQRVYQNCAPDPQAACGLFIPPVEAHFFREKNPTWSPPPPLSPECRSLDEAPMAWTYPRPSPTLYLPYDPTKGTGQAVFQLAHQYPEREVYWFLDGAYLGTTHQRHDMPVQAPAGRHRLLAVDDEGVELPLSFAVASE